MTAMIRISATDNLTGDFLGKGRSFTGILSSPVVGVKLSTLICCHQTPVLPQNALRVRSPRTIQCCENSDEKIPSDGLLSAKDGLGRDGFGHMVGGLFHR
jgi:hypothetical protein